ncbi:MAG TPA: autotransporter outer membrane beta-barrel domain-containing protein [Thiothrix sp.]|nr:autotransporter outer membrane beta-barrel domain-containing protein [Thiothrix sp.]
MNIKRYKLIVSAFFYTSFTSLNLVQVSIAAQTTLQSNTGASVLSECQNLPRAQGLTALQQDLDTRCTHIASNLNGSTGSTNTNTPGLSDTELEGALQQVATEEASAAGTVSTRTTYHQTGNIVNRLSSLRRSDKVLGGGAGDDTGEIGTGFDKASVFVNGVIGTVDKNQTDREDGFEMDSQGIIIGADYRPTSDTVVGVALGYNRFDSDFESNSAGSVLGGSLEADSTNLSIYGSKYMGDIYVDGVLGFGKSDYDLDRVIRYPGVDRVAKGSTDGKQFAASIGVGMNKQQGTITYGPYGRVHYQDIDIDGYAESGALGMNMTVNDQQIKSTKSVMGIHASKSTSQSFGVLSPHINAEWHHEFEDDARQISSYFTVDPNQTVFISSTDRPDRDYFTLDGGVSVVHTNGIQSFVNASVLLGQKHIDSSYGVTAGVRVEF